MNSKRHPFDLKETDARGYRAAEVPPEMQMLSEKRREGFLRAFQSIRDKRDRIKAYSALASAAATPKADHEAPKGD